MEQNNITVDTTVQLGILDILVKGSIIGLKNIIPLLLAFILWALTIWIPYINVGTTIALFTIPKLLAEGKMFNPLSIFKSEYRKMMGEFFLVLSLMNQIIFLGLLFMIIPGIIMAIRYMFAPILVVDQKVNPTDALLQSNEMTEGYKLRIIVPFVILSVISGLTSGILLPLTMPIGLAMVGYIYGELLKRNK